MSRVTRSGVVIENTGRRGLGGMGIRVPHGGLIMVAKLSNSNGDSLTFSAVCTRKREECIRDLSSCTEVFLNRVSGPGIRDVRKLSPTVSVSRGAASGGPHSAINAIARVCSCLHLLCTEVNIPRYAIYKERVHRRAISRVISGVVACRANAGVRIVTPIMENEGNRRTGILSDTKGSNCIHTEISKVVCSLSRGVPVRGGGGRGVRVVISHLMVGPRVTSELSSDVRATSGLNNNLIAIGFGNSRSIAFSRGCTYPRRNIDVSRLSPEVFSFGGPFNTYPGYAKLNMFLGVSRGGVVPSVSGDVHSNNVGNDN